MNETERSCITAVRTLTIDAIEKAESGHPGMPMGMAPLAYLLYGEIMKHDPRDPAWPDRDRFVLSCGHGSMWLYTALHLSGYDLSIDDLKDFRQWGGKTPGHPELEYHDGDPLTPGVEVTTGPLGQGTANSVGMAMAEHFLRDRYGSEVVDHRTWAIVSDGDLMEGIASEAASIAGQIGLDRLTWFYDDNDISLDGPTSLSFSREDVSARFEAYGWHVLDVGDAEDLDSLRRAIDAAKDETERPTLIHVHSIIGFPSPNKQGKSASHGSPLGPDEARATKEAMGADPDKTFDVPSEVYDAFSAVARGGEAHSEWTQRYQKWEGENPSLAEEWRCARDGRPPASLEGVIPTEWDDKLATRAAGGKVMAAFEEAVPTMVGGAADLTESTKTIFPKAEQFTHERPGRNVFFGVREHAMGGIVNGMAAHGGIVRPYGSTFLQFADYMRGSIRLSALMNLDSTWVFTHDSVALGEDGPTHQPVEHVAALRAIPNLVVLRPADATETAEAWRIALEELRGPVALILTRQGLPTLDRSEYGTVSGVGMGAYVLSGAGGEDEDAAIVATGSEVSLALEAQKKLAEVGTHVRVVSMPSWELFEEQDERYRDEVLPPDLPTVSVEAGISMGWERYSDAQVAIDRFGASAPGPVVMEKLGITVEHVTTAVEDVIG